MGRQEYINRLALGRSPYEAPETRGATSSATVNADGYVQHYDERGHPVNPASKALGRQLRRAKNDVLSTMGIVVSGEDGKLGISKERHKVNLLTAENDYGLVMTTLDQVMMFLGSWWTMSLGGRILTFRSYTHVPLITLIRLEQRSVGLVGFYFSGILAWAASFTLSICRNHLLEPLILFLESQLLPLSSSETYGRLVRIVFSTLHTMTRGALFALFGQTYMFSLLQSLHLVHPYAIPSLYFFVPFSRSSLIQLPSLPVDLSLRAISEFLLGVFTAPFSLIYLFIYLRPIIEGRIYRLLRRRLPKPDHPDELSIRAALENDLIEWTVPSLGRRSDEEFRRGNFTLFQEIKYELSALKNWTLSWLGWKQEKTSDGETIVPSREEGAHLCHRIEQLQHEQLEATIPGTNPPRPRRRNSLSQGNRLNVQQDSGSPGPTASTQTPEPEALFNMDELLASDRLVQSPVELSPDLSNGVSGSSRIGLDGIPRLETSTISEPPRSIDQNARNERPHSQSNTLFSHPSSPESSPPTSPRVRASLVHQNSEIITMQLELLGNRHPSNDQAVTGPDVDHRPHQNDILSNLRSLNRSASELLDALLSNQGRSAAHTDHPDGAGVYDRLSGVASDDPPRVADSPGPLQRGVIDQQARRDPNNDTASVATVPEGTTILPDGVEETRHQPSTDSESDYSVYSGPRPLSSNTRTRGRSNTISSPTTHRVTILSSHPADSLASHLASLMTTLLFAPLESLYLRSLALAYLSSSAPGNANAGLRSDIRSLYGWVDSSRRQDTLAYISKFVLVMGMQSVVSTGVWGLCTAAVVGLGRRAFGWGNL